MAASPGTGGRLGAGQCGEVVGRESNQSGTRPEPAGRAWAHARGHTHAR